MKKIFFIVVIAALFLVGCTNKEPEKKEMKTLDSLEWTSWGDFTMDGRNSTPPRRVNIDEGFIEVRAEYTTDRPVLFLLGVYSGGNEVIPNFKANPPAKEGVAEIKIPVKKGYEIQVYNQIWMEDGVYDDNYPVDIKLSYRMVK